MKLKKALAYFCSVFMLICTFIIISLPKVPNWIAIVILAAGILGAAFASTLAAESEN